MGNQIPGLKLDPDDVVVVHLSDLHLGAKQSEEVWDLLQQYLGSLRELGEQRALLLVTGDLADTPHPKLYEDARRKLDALKVDYYVCAGNHDRHVKGNNLRFLRRLPRAVWIAAAAALVATTTAGLWVPWFWLVPLLVVIAALGWLIWQRRYNGAEFDTTFAGHLATRDKVVPHELRSGNCRWRVGILGLESSARSDASARGYVDVRHFGDIDAALTKQIRQDAVNRQSLDLCVLLVHHHLLSVRELEAKHQGAMSHLLNLTCLVNAGSLLERLSQSHVDLIAHGHEHASHWAQFRSCEFNSGAVRVVGAGSATGNDSLQGCDNGRISFNLLVLASDRSVWLHKVRHDGSSWIVDRGPRLFDASDLRLSAFRRASLLAPDRLGLITEVSKHVEFAPNRDIHVTWTFTDWQPQERIRHQIYNATGRLDEENPVEVRIVDERGGEFILKHVSVTQTPGRDHFWDIDAEVPQEVRRSRLATLMIGYSWLHGAVLTQEDLESVVGSQGGGWLRNEGYEFSVMWTPIPVAAAELIVSLPPDFEPTTAPRVRVREASEEDRAEGADLQRRLRRLAAGRYALLVPYPRVGRHYEVYWRPVSDAVVNQRTGALPFEQFAPEQHKALLYAFRDGLQSLPELTDSSLALYVRNAPSSATLKRAACIPGRDDVPLSDQPAPQCRLRGDRHLVAQAWWGEAAIQTRPDSPQLALEQGFLANECMLLSVPLRFEFGWTNPPPSAVVRIGILGTDSSSRLSAAELQPMLGSVLARAALMCLTRALNGSTLAT